MAEADGMLLNFDVGDTPLQSTTIFRGGPWKARLSAKKRARRQQSKATNKGDRYSTDKFAVRAGEEEVILPNKSTPVEQYDRPVKRQRLEDGVDQTRTIVKPDQIHKTGTSSGLDKDPSSSKSGTIISSLFTFNPKSTAPKEDRTEENAAAQPSNAPLPDGLSSFTDLGISSSLGLHLLQKLGLDNPTSIQKEAVLSLIQNDRDAFIQAETGSGKTLAYLLPIVERLMAASRRSKGKLHRGSGLFAIILAPTHELCRQISIVLESLLRCANWIVAGTIMGGDNKRHEKARLRKGLNILVATPGRLVDHLDHTKVLDTRKTCWLVLDEGDKLMELGFEDDIRKIMEHIHRPYNPAPELLTSRKITILCSATMERIDKDIERLGDISLKGADHFKPKTATPALDENPTQALTAPAQLNQSYAIVPSKQRLVTLFAVLKRALATSSIQKAIIFVSCADSVDFHFLALSHPHSDPPSSTTTNISLSMFPSAQLYRLHGSLERSLRTSTLRSFRTTSDPAILVSTDVSARGLDVPNLDLVLEVDPPADVEDHMHRIGRTARAGRSGRAMIFLAPGAEEGYIPALQSCVAPGRKLTRHDAENLLKKGFSSPGLGGEDDWAERASDWQLGIERWVEGDERVGRIARKAWRSSINSYQTHQKEDREVFDKKKMHLGHFAKAFGLRERPADVGRGAKRDAAADQIDDGGEEDRGVKRERQRKMGAGLKGHMDAGGEFNIG
ncbi:MAG: ATP-dependent RNA helicase dbp7 [Vezdaea aestivalis]|nr:MAG: ATP-dependent RNA helicase dbp7 [Vezdaea aestivalis]